MGEGEGEKEEKNKKVEGRREEKNPGLEYLFGNLVWNFCLELGVGIHETYMFGTSPLFGTLVWILVRKL